MARSYPPEFRKKVLDLHVPEASGLPRHEVTTHLWVGLPDGTTMLVTGRTHPTQADRNRR